MTLEEYEAIWHKAMAGDDESVRHCCHWCDYSYGDQRHCREHIMEGTLEVTMPACVLADHRKRILEAEGKSETDMLMERKP